MPRNARLKPGTTSLGSVAVVVSGFSRTSHTHVVSGFTRTCRTHVVSGFSRTCRTLVVSGFSRTSIRSGVVSASRPLADDERGGLEAQRLAAAGRQHHDAVAAREHGVHRLALQRPEVREAPDAVKRVTQDGVPGADYDFLW